MFAARKKTAPIRKKTTGKNFKAALSCPPVLSRLPSQLDDASPRVSSFVQHLRYHSPAHLRFRSSLWKKLGEMNYYVYIYIYTWVIDPHFFPSLLGDLLIPCVAASKGRFLSPPANKKHPPPCSTWHLPGEETLGETETLQLQSAANISQQKRILYIDGKNVTKIGVSKTLQVFRSQGHNSLNGGYSYHPFFNAWWQQLLKGSYNQRPFFDATFMLQFSTQGTPEAPDIKVMRTMRTPRF